MSVYASKKINAGIIIVIFIVLSVLLLGGCNRENPPVSEQKTDPLEKIQDNETELDPVINKIIAGDTFSGQALDNISGKSWRCNLCMHTFNAETGEISGTIEWPDLEATHRIKGKIDSNKLIFEETDYIKKGSAYLGVTYTMLPEGDCINGVWSDKRNNQQGTVSLALSSNGEEPGISADEATAGSNPGPDSGRGEEGAGLADPANGSLGYEYGRSGYDEPLLVYRLAGDNPSDGDSRKILCVFAIHGFEDAFYRDGQMLVDIGHDVIEYFYNNTPELKNYELMVIPCANPDGVKQGWTCNGPGRCQLSQGIDINMDFDYSFIVRTNDRNKTGDKPFSSPEAAALKDLVLQEKPDIIIDFHGWINCASGDKEISDVFCTNLGLIYEPEEEAIYKGFFSGWAAKYARSVLVEYPDPYSGRGACNIKSDQKYDYTREKLDQLQYSKNTVNAIKAIIDSNL